MAFLINMFYCHMLAYTIRSRSPSHSCLISYYMTMSDLREDHPCDNYWSKHLKSHSILLIDVMNGRSYRMLMKIVDHSTIDLKFCFWQVQIQVVYVKLPLICPGFQRLEPIFIAPCLLHAQSVTRGSTCHPQSGNCPHRPHRLMMMSLTVWRRPTSGRVHSQHTLGIRQSVDVVVPWSRGSHISP